MSCVLAIGVIARSTSSYTGPTGAIGTSLPDSCLFAEPNHKYIHDAKLHVNLSCMPLLFLLVTTKRNMTTSKISTTTIATKPTERAATFHAPTPIGQYAA